MKQTKTAKARKITFNKKTTEQIAQTVAAMGSAVVAKETKDQSAIDLGRVIDSKTGANVPIFPLLNVNPNAKWTKFKEKHGDAWSRAEWQRGMAFALLLKSALDDSAAEFKHEAGTIKRNCMHWSGSKKGKEAIQRARRANLENPEGKTGSTSTTSTTSTTSKDKDTNPLTANKQHFANLITSFNTLADAQGVAGLPASDKRDAALAMVIEAQRLMHSE